MRSSSSWQADRLRRSLLGSALAFAGLAAGWLAGRRAADLERDRLHRALVELLLNTLSAGDVVTARHSRRVADLTDAMADSYALSRRERARLRLAALLHDMGKIEDRFFDIVHSRAPLSATQRREIKHHPHESAYILEPLERIHPGIMEIVSSHHECWDGSGYPRGVRGEQIPLSARIIAVADVFDAMTQRRRYRDALPVEAVLAELAEGAGSLFDPEVVARVESPRVFARWRQIVREGREEERRDPAPVLAPPASQ